MGSYGTLSIRVGHGFRYWGAVASDEVKSSSAESLFSMWWKLKTKCLSEHEHVLHGKVKQRKTIEDYGWHGDEDAL